MNAPYNWGTDGSMVGPGPVTPAGTIGRAVVLVDHALLTFATRGLIAGTEVVDVLLDVRATLTSTAAA